MNLCLYLSLAHKQLKQLPWIISNPIGPEFTCFIRTCALIDWGRVIFEMLKDIIFCKKAIVLRLSQQEIFRRNLDLHVCKIKWIIAILRMNAILTTTKELWLEWNIKIIPIFLTLFTIWGNFSIFLIEQSWDLYRRQAFVVEFMIWVHVHKNSATSCASDKQNLGRC